MFGGLAELLLVAAMLGLLLVGLLVFAATVLVRRARRGTLRTPRDGFARAGEERGLPLSEAYEQANASSAWTRTTP
ncbi:hypothetical protein SAMN06264364_111104 [Quadrisphaera granulorum]|uniref:Uncharacterized protein n=1 Tax=Quadrisphaera granulorum TaxID=317664 RepID=A0A316A747_9ACTN|nr:hypothetical protein BXY45_111104 [Quadrisphaera granulorum]SZE96745.1 hypothetical protein SAMN06264364_111104 [Quadrisphaera granulorum]